MSHAQRLCPSCSSPGLESRSGALFCVSLVLFPVVSSAVLWIKPYKGQKKCLTLKHTSSVLAPPMVSSSLWEFLAGEAKGASQFSCLLAPPSKMAARKSFLSTILQAVPITFPLLLRSFSFQLNCSHVSLTCVFYCIFCLSNWGFMGYFSCLLFAAHCLKWKSYLSTIYRPSQFLYLCLEDTMWGERTEEICFKTSFPLQLQLKPHPFLITAGSSCQSALTAVETSYEFMLKKQFFMYVFTWLKL